MKPASVNILGKTYSITYVDKPSDVDIHGYTSLWGQIDYWTRTIRIYDNGRSCEDIWHSIMHETLHGITNALNMDVLEGKDCEDDVDLLALALVDVFFRNGWLLESTRNGGESEGEQCESENS